MKTLHIALIAVFVVLMLMLILGLSIGLTINKTFDGTILPDVPPIVKYVDYVSTPIGDVTFAETECDLCTSIKNLGSSASGAPKSFTVTDVLGMSLVMIDVNLLITDLVVESATRPIMFYGNTKDSRIINNSVIAFHNYYRYDRPFFVNFTETTKGFWKLQCDFLSTFIEPTSTTMLTQLCIWGQNIVAVTANVSNVSLLLETALLKYRIFSKIAENVLVIDSNPQTLRNKWVKLICPTTDICATSCTICKTTNPNYRLRKNTVNQTIEKSTANIAFGVVTFESTIIPGKAFLMPGDMFVTWVEIQSTNAPAMVEIIDGAVVAVPVVFVKTTAGAWVWDVDIFYNHLRRKIYLLSEDDTAATMTMYYIETADLPFETADFKRKGYIAQRGATFLSNMVFSDCLCY